MTLVDLAVVGTNLTIVANFESEVDRVYMIFKFDNSFTNREANPPFALNGNIRTKIKEYGPLGRVGKHTIVASLYSKGTNLLLATQTVEMSMINTNDSMPGPIDQFYLIDTSIQTTRPFLVPRVIRLGTNGTSYSVGIDMNDNENGTSIRFWLDDSFVRKEGKKPWSLGGNNKNIYKPSKLLSKPGLYNITAVAFDSNDKMLGYSQVPFSIEWDMTSKQPISPIPTKFPTVAPNTNTPTFQPPASTMPSLVNTTKVTSKPTNTATLTPTSKPTVLDTDNPIATRPTLTPNISKTEVLR
jgi:hypothetical protein